MAARRQAVGEETMAAAGAELQWSWRRKKGRRDLFEICENFKDFTANKDFPLF